MERRCAKAGISFAASLSGFAAASASRVSTKRGSGSCLDGAPFSGATCSGAFSRTARSTLLSPLRTESRSTLERRCAKAGISFAASLSGFAAASESRICNRRGSGSCLDGVAFSGATCLGAFSRTARSTLLSPLRTESRSTLERRCAKAGISLAASLSGLAAASESRICNRRGSGSCFGRLAFSGVRATCSGSRSRTTRSTLLSPLCTASRTALASRSATAGISFAGSRSGFTAASESRVRSNRGSGSCLGGVTFSVARATCSGSRSRTTRSTLLSPLRAESRTALARRSANAGISFAASLSGLAAASASRVFRRGCRDSNLPDKICSDRGAAAVSFDPCTDGPTFPPLSSCESEAALRSDVRRSTAVTSANKRFAVSCAPLGSISSRSISRIWARSGSSLGSRIFCRAALSSPRARHSLTRPLRSAITRDRPRPAGASAAPGISAFARNEESSLTASLRPCSSIRLRICASRALMMTALFAARSGRTAVSPSDVLPLVNRTESSPPPSSSTRKS